jgi:hypothetical protein
MGANVIPRLVLTDPARVRRLALTPLELRLAPALPPILTLGLISFTPFEVSLIRGLRVVMSFFFRLLGIDSPF